MSLKNGFPATIIKFAVPASASGVAFTNGGLAIGSLKAGRYLCVLSYALDPVTGGANILTVNSAVTSVAILGAGTAVGLVQYNTQPANIADINARISVSSVVTLPADAPIFISIVATVSAGNYISSAAVLDGQSNSISFIQLQ